MVATNGSNGYHGMTTDAIPVPQNEAQAERALTGLPLSLDYKPSVATLALAGLASGGWSVNYNAFTYDVESMLAHPDVNESYNFWRSGVSNIEAKLRASSSAVGEYADRMLRRFWERSLDQVQHAADYGWGAGELCYCEERGQLVYHSLRDFHALDSYALTVDHRYVGVSVHGAGERAGLKLWGPTHWPAKGWWLVHNRRYDRFYGRSQLFPAWKPWRRLATRDGAEEVVDAGFYRFAFRGPVVRYPVEDFKRQDGGEIDYDAARNAAREIAEQAKAGFSAALPGSRDTKGEYKWIIEWPDSTINIAPLLDYPTALRQQISRGIGVPPELLEASEVGSGWSGRAIPMLAFYTGQTGRARAIVQAWKEQVGDPLVKWNFGPEAWFEVEVEVVLPSALAAQQGTQGQEGKGGPGGDGADGKGAGGNPFADLLGGKTAGAQPQGEAPGDDEQGGGAQLSTLPALEGLGFTLAADGEGGAGGASKPADSWQPYTGKRGARAGQQGWKNVHTGRVAWGEKPGGRRGKQAAPASAPTPTQATAAAASAARRAPRGGKASPDEAHAHLSRLLADPSKITADDIHQAKEMLLALTVPGLQELKKRLGVTGSERRKDALADAIASRLTYRPEGEGKGGERLEDRSRSDLYRAAKEKGLPVKWGMKREVILAALKGAEKPAPVAAPAQPAAPPAATAPPPQPAPAQAPPAKPAAPRAAARASPERLRDDLAAHVKSLFAGMKPASKHAGTIGMQVPIHQLRDWVRQQYGERAASHQVFDRVMHELRQRGDLDFVTITDNRDGTARQHADSIPGVNETFFYVTPHTEQDFDFGGGGGEEKPAEQPSARQQPPPALAPTKTPTAAPAADPAAVAARVRDLYGRAKEPTVTPGMIDAAVRDLAALPTADLSRLAADLHIAGIRGREQLLHAIGHTVRDRKGSFERNSIRFDPYPYVAPFAGTRLARGEISLADARQMVDRNLASSDPETIREVARAHGVRGGSLKEQRQRLLDGALAAMQQAHDRHLADQHFTGVDPFGRQWEGGKPTGRTGLEPTVRPRPQEKPAPRPAAARPAPTAAPSKPVPSAPRQPATPLPVSDAGRSVVDRVKALYAGAAALPLEQVRRGVEEVESLSAGDLKALAQAVGVVGASGSRQHLADLVKRTILERKGSHERNKR